jgi:hypothetical protein
VIGTPILARDPAPESRFSFIMLICRPAIISGISQKVSNDTYFVNLIFDVLLTG